MAGLDNLKGKKASPFVHGGGRKKSHPRDAHGRKKAMAKKWLKGSADMAFPALQGTKPKPFKAPKPAFKPVVAKPFKPKTPKAPKPMIVKAKPSPTHGMPKPAKPAFQTKQQVAKKVLGNTAMNYANKYTKTSGQSIAQRAAQPGHFLAKAAQAAQQGNVAATKKFKAKAVQAHLARVAAAKTR